MSNSTHTITLIAKSTGLTQMFEAIKRGATEDAAALKKLGADSSAAIKQVDTSAKQTAKSLDDVGKGAKLAAIGATALAGSLPPP